MSEAQVLAVSTLVTGVLTLLTIIWRDYAAMRRARQLHEWDKEERSFVAREANHKAAVLHHALESNTKLTQETKDAAHDAYQEANSVNAKLEKFGLEQNQTQKRTQGHGRT